MIFNCAVCSGFIMSGVFTEISNVAMEEGLQTWQASTLVIYSAIPEVINSMYNMACTQYHYFWD